MPSFLLSNKSSNIVCGVLSKKVKRNCVWCTAVQCMETEDSLSCAKSFDSLVIIYSPFP